MFTGIVEAVGEISGVEPRGGDLRLGVRCPALDTAGIKPGNSIATNGVCLTVVELEHDGFAADVSQETLAHSTFAAARTGQRVNLERAMPADGRFDGHIVSGHVDGIGRILERRSLRLTLQAPAELAKYIAPKGSVCIDGVSLTVNRVDGAAFELNIVPHTAAHTIIDGYRAGTGVNIEVDVVARYLERLLTGSQADAAGAISESFLAEHGFWKAR